MTKSRNAIICLLTGWGLCLGGAVAPPTRAEDKTKSLYESKILPVLRKHCYECHSTQTKKSEGGLTLDKLDAILRGGDRGPAVVPNDVDESILVAALKYEDEDLQMPPNGKLSDEVIQNFVQWIQQGAKAGE